MVRVGPKISACPGLGCRQGKADALGLSRKKTGRRGLPEGRFVARCGKQEQSKPHPPPPPQHRMGLSYGEGARPGEGEGEEKAAAATPAALWSYGGKEPDGRGRQVFKHRPL